MSLLEHVWPWTQQPQGACTVDRAAPGADSLIALLPLGGDDRDLIGGQRLTLAANGSIGVDARGLSLRGVGAACASVPLDLSAHSVITVSFWLWWDAWANNDALALELGTDFVSARGFFIDPNESALGRLQVAVGAPGVAGAKSFARPSAGVWHHYMVGIDRSIVGGVPAAYVDGVAQSLTTDAAATVGGAFGSATLYLFSRANSSLFGAGRMQNLAIRAGLPTQALAGWEYSSPWQLFEPQRLVIPTSAAAPAVPAITFVGAENILATSASYRVSLNYA